MGSEKLNLVVARTIYGREKAGTKNSKAFQHLIGSGAALLLRHCIKLNRTADIRVKYNVRT